MQSNNPNLSEFHYRMPRALLFVFVAYLLLFINEILFDESKKGLISSIVFFYTF